MPLQLRSVFQNGEAIPAAYTCDGAGISPPLSWTGTPDGTQSFALLSEDPDAPRGLWVHWVLFNLPPETTSLPAGVPNIPVLPNGAQQGLNTGRHIGYGSPCPPSGVHRYYFILYALDIVLPLTGSVTREGLLQAMEGHCLAESRLMGRYSREA